MPAPPTSPCPAIVHLLDRVALAPRQSHKQLALWPLVLRPGFGSAPPAAYTTLPDALESGALSVSEVGEGASVSHVQVDNRGERAVLVLFGEEILGAKQNRVANASFLIPPKGKVAIDVSCVEAGRWRSRGGATGDQFRSSHGVSSSSLRRKMARSVLARRLGGAAGYPADQREVWDEVDLRLKLSQTLSPSNAYADYVGSRSTDLDAIGAAFRPAAGQVGFIAEIGDAVVGAEVIGDPEVFARAFLGLLRAYAIDSVDAAALGASLGLVGNAGPPRFDGPEPFLEALAQAPAQVGASLGLGEDVRIEGDGVAGCALVHGELVHLTAFPQ